MSKSNPNPLKATIDRMVEQAIREILPEVMNEVLMKTLAGATMNETRAPVRRQQAPAPQQRRAQPQQRPSPNLARQQQLAGLDRSLSLREALSGDDAGSDYYEEAERMLEQRRPSQPRPAPQRQPVRQPIVEQQYDEDEMYGEDEIFDFSSPPPAPKRQAPPPQRQQSMQEQVMAQRISELPPALQNLAEDTFRLVGDDEFEDDGGEWGTNEFAPTAGALGPRAPALNIDRAADALGLDFSRFAQTIQVTEGTNKPKITQQDVQNEANWKMQQLERKRALLDAKKVG